MVFSISKYNNLIVNKKYLLQKSPFDCRQYNNQFNLPVVNSIKTQCEGKNSCRFVPSRISLSECGNKQATYLHLEYVCDTSKYIYK